MNSKRNVERHVFVSHAERDRALASELVGVLAENGVRAWHIGEVEPGKNSSRETARELDAADAMVVLVRRRRLLPNTFSTS